MLIAVVSTLVFFSVIGWVIVSSPSWPLVQQDFFDAGVFWRYLPVIGSAFVTNIALFLIAEALVLVLGLFIAVLRSLPGRCSSRSAWWRSPTPTSSGACPAC